MTVKVIVTDSDSKSRSNKSNHIIVIIRSLEAHVVHGLMPAGGQRPAASDLQHLLPGPALLREEISWHCECRAVHRFPSPRAWYVCLRGVS